MPQKATFKFTPKKRPAFQDAIYGLYNNPDFRQYIWHNIDTGLSVTIEPTHHKSEKMRMYAYLNGPLIETVMYAMTEAGDSVDKAQATMEMKVLFAKDTHTDREGNTHLVVMSQSDMTKKRLLKFIKDIIRHLEDIYDTSPPDADRYREMMVSKEHGGTFEKITNFKKRD